MQGWEFQCPVHREDLLDPVPVQVHSLRHMNRFGVHREDENRRSCARRAGWVLSPRSWLSVCLTEAPGQTALKSHDVSLKK